MIDTILDGHDVVTTWFKHDPLKTLLNNRQQLLQKCGLWGCLMGAIVAGKLAKYHIHINCDQHLQTCLLASHFLRAIFFYTLPHSEHDLDYATLIIDQGSQIWPGIQLTSDEFRLNPAALMDALAYTCDALIRHDICLHVSDSQRGTSARRAQTSFLSIESTRTGPVRCLRLALP